MKKILLYLPSIIFNVVEVSVIVLIGILLKLSINQIAIIFALFATIRISLGGSLHYKDWYRCMIWSTLIFLSLFVVAKQSLPFCIIMTLFSAYILTTKGNIKDIFMWGGCKLNQEVYDWVKFNQNNPQLLKYENQLKNTDNKKYIIFKYRFKEYKSYGEIAKLMDIPEQRVCDELKIISHFIEYSIRLG